MELSIFSLGQGRERLSILVLRDLSEQERSEGAARAQLLAETTLKARTLMISYLAHEIGNPLNAILGFTELMQCDSTQPLPAAQAKRLQHVAEAGEHLLALMRDVLNMQRLESGTFDMAPAVVDVAAATGRAVRTLSAQAAQAGIALTLEPVQDRLAPALKLFADETRLHQCLLILLSNAIKYKSPGGQVRIRLRRSGACCCFEIEDDGPGPDADQQQHLFEPFNRVGRNGSGGSGIGLALTRLLASAMDGGVTVTSQVGRGSCFVLSLPAAAA